LSAVSSRWRAPAAQGHARLDIDLRFIKTQCRGEQGNLDGSHEQIGFLKSELVRCNDTI